MSELASALKDSVVRVFQEEVDRDCLHAQEATGWVSHLWDLTEELGLTQVLVSEASGGVGGDWADAYEVIRECGRFGVPLPIPETLVGRWLLERCEMEQVQGPLTLVRDEPVVHRVPWARNASAACFTRVTGSGTELVVAELADARMELGTNLANEPRDSFSLNELPVRCAPIALPSDAILYLGAMLRSAQISGVAVELLELAIQHADERSQFGRSLIKFQVIQHNLARLASAAASLDAVSRMAFEIMDTVGFTDDPCSDARFAIAAAKCRASDCVDMICSISHQVHGAISFTYEHNMHFFTRRAWSWRSEFGSGSHWAERLGKIALNQGGDGTWELVTGLDKADQKFGLTQVDR